jgi:hypothetical protein
MEKHPSFNLTNLLQRDRIESKLNLSVQVERAPQAPTSTTITYFLDKQLNQFIDDLVHEQLQNADRLRSLNPSRRESLGKFLAELSKLPEPANPQEILKEFTSSDRSLQALDALKQLFKQIAMVQIGKALLLKSWNKDKFSTSDLKNLTSAINREMGNFVNLQTSTSQLIQQNFYSWYNLSLLHQDQLWELILMAEKEDPSLEKIKEWVFQKARKLSAETLGERDRYGKLFYQYLWTSIRQNQLIRSSDRTVYGFCPTLRDGSMMDHAPEHIEWIGFEPLSFELLFCEIRYLWGQRKSLPLWIRGSSLEMSMEPQSSLHFTHSGKQNTLQQIESISSCEISIISEENMIRTQSRSMAGQALRKQIEEHSILKKVKESQSTRGMYQACQALDKLRQGGVLIWAREEVLNESSGKPILQFILNQAKLLFIADLSALQCNQENIKKDLPKALYVLQRENDLETRKGHRPLMIKTYGSIESSLDIQLLFDRVFSLLKKPEQTFPHEPFQIHSRISPIEQREWEQHWFNPADDQMVDQIENLKRNSTPMGELAIIRMVPWSDLTRANLNHQQMHTSMDGTPHRFFLWNELNDRGNQVITADESELTFDQNKKGHVFIVYPRESRWSVPLQSLICSQLTRDWLDYSAERKKGSWFLKESDIKSIPVPKHIYLYLKEMNNNESFQDLNGYEHKIISMVPSKPGESLTLLESDKTHSTHLKARIFVLASEVLYQQKKDQKTLFSMIEKDGMIKQDVMEKIVLQENDLCRLDQHPLIRFTPTIPEHQALNTFTHVQHPTPGIMMATSKGLTQFLHIQDLWIRDQILDKIVQLRTHVAEPTWNEICQMIRIPKNPEQTRLITAQLVNAYHTEKMRKKELIHLIGACLIENHENSNKSRIGLLQ